MRKKIIIFYQYLSGIIIVLLAFATFFIQKENPEIFSQSILVRIFALDHFYDSYVNIFLFSLMIILVFVSIIIGVLKKRSTVIFHVILALVFILIIFDKSFNSRQFISIPEGTEINFGDIVKNSSDKYNKNLFLENFKIVHHPNSKMPKAYTSKIIIDHKDTIKINVNKPFKIGKYRLYQSAYESQPQYEILINDSKAKLFVGDTIKIGENILWLENMNRNSPRMILHINSEVCIINSDGAKIKVNDIPIKIKLIGIRYITILDVAETTGMKFLLILGIGFLLLLGIVFWRKK